MTQTAVRMQKHWTDDHWTEADLAELPQDGTRYEIIDGRLYVTPPAGESHQGPAGGLFALLRMSAPPGWRVLYEIGLRIGEHRLIPDITVLPPDTPIADHDYNDVTIIKPALVVEVASKSTEMIDLGNKMVAYALGKIPSYWRVTRDSVVHLHQLNAVGQYGLLSTVQPGEDYQTQVPFPLLLEPAKLKS